MKNLKKIFMNNTARPVVERMFTAFGNGDIEGFLKTVSPDTIWIYHGTQIIPKGTYKGTEGARAFISNIINNTEILSFEPQQYICDGNTVVVLGREHQRVKKSGRELKQKWAQVYTVENGLITRMEEFATSDVEGK
jgi:ketosteroid isomerase-like protein